VERSLEERLLQRSIYRTFSTFALDAAKSTFSCRVFSGQAGNGVFPNERREIAAGQIIYKEVNIVASLGYQLE
jgi:hypothetical protein